MSLTTIEAVDKVDDIGIATAVGAAVAEQSGSEDANAKLQAEATALLTKMVKYFRAGEQSYCRVLVNTGKLCLSYLEKRLALGASRANVIQAIEGHLAPYATAVVDANRMIRAAEAYRLLTEQAGEVAKTSEPRLSYGALRDHFSRLVERKKPATPQEAESYALLAGMETECLDCFRRCTADKLDSKAIGDAVTAICRTHTFRRDELAKRDAESKRAETEAAKAAAEQARKEREQAMVVARVAEVEAAKASATANAEQAAKLVEAAEAAAKELREKQEKEIAANQEQTLRLQKQAEAEKEAKNAEKSKKNQIDKDLREAEKAVENQALRSPPECRQQESLLRATKTGTAKDLASMACKMITDGEEPDTAFEHLITLLDEHEDLSKASHRAVKAAIVVLRNAALASAPTRSTASVA